MLPIRHQIRRIGGSNAQRDLFNPRSGLPRGMPTAQSGGVTG